MSGDMGKCLSTVTLVVISDFGFNVVCEIYLSQINELLYV